MACYTKKKVKVVAMLPAISRCLFALFSALFMLHCVSVTPSCASFLQEEQAVTESAAAVEQSEGSRIIAPVRDESIAAHKDYKSAEESIAARKDYKSAEEVVRGFFIYITDKVAAVSDESTVGFRSFVEEISTSGDDQAPSSLSETVVPAAEASSSWWSSVVATEQGSSVQSVGDPYITSVVSIPSDASPLSAGLNAEPSLTTTVITNDPQPSLTTTVITNDPQPSLTTTVITNDSDNGADTRSSVGTAATTTTLTTTTTALPPPSRKSATIPQLANYEQQQVAAMAATLEENPQDDLRFDWDTQLPTGLVLSCLTTGGPPTPDNAVILRFSGAARRMTRDDIPFKALGECGALQTEEECTAHILSGTTDTKVCRWDTNTLALGAKYGTASCNSVPTTAFEFSSGLGAWFDAMERYEGWGYLNVSDDLIFMREHELFECLQYSDQGPEVCNSKTDSRGHPCSMCEKVPADYYPFLDPPIDPNDSNYLRLCLADYTYPTFCRMFGQITTMCSTGAWWEPTYPSDDDEASTTTQPAPPVEEATDGDDAKGDNSSTGDTGGFEPSTVHTSAEPDAAKWEGAVPGGWVLKVSAAVAVAVSTVL